jgi:hypothetical protein
MANERQGSKDIAFVQTPLLPAPVAQNEQEGVTGVSLPVIGTVTGPENERQGGNSLSMQGISGVSSVNNEQPASSSVALAVIPLAHPPENEQDTELDVALLDLPETRGAEDEPDLQQKTSYATIQPVAQTPNEADQFAAKVPLAVISTVTPPENDKLLKYPVPLNGKVIVADNQTTIGANFRVMKNMRYTDTHPKSVSGMTKIATTSLLQQDFTGYTESDPGSDITVAAGTITLAGVDVSTNSYVSTGAGGYGDCTDHFVHEFNFRISAISDGAYSYVWYVDDGSGNYLGLCFDGIGSSVYKIRLRGNDCSPAQIDIFEAAAVNTTYYVRIVRADYAGGSSSNLIIYIFSDSSFATSVASYTASIIHRTYTHLYAFKVPASGSGTISGTVNSYVISQRFPYNAYHYAKASPAETHLIGETGKTILYASTTSYGGDMYESETAIPSTGNLDTLFHDASIGGIPHRFSTAPLGQIVFCRDGQYGNTYIWGGDEMPCSAFITSTAEVTAAAFTNPRDYSAQVIDTCADSDSVAYIGGGIDSYTVFMLHCDGANGSTIITDSETAGAAKSQTAQGDAKIVTAQAKFGTGSLYFDGTGDYVTSPDSDDWFMDDDPFTIDFWTRFSTVNNKRFFSQYIDANNVVAFIYNSGTGKLYFYIIDTTTSIVDLQVDWSPSINTWYHISVVRGWGGNADSVSINVNGTSLGTATITAGAKAWPQLAAAFNVGYDGTVETAAMWIDEFRVSKGIARWTANFSAPTLPYISQALYWLVAYTRPLSGVKFYIPAATANSTANTLTVKEWNGNSWNALTVTADGTRTGGTTSLAQTGLITWASTVSTSKPKFIEGQVLYWYQFSVDAGSAEIYYCTVNSPVQPLLDLWDGIERNVAAFFKYTTVYTDYTSNVFADAYDSSDNTTYADLNALGVLVLPGDNNAVLAGFTERMTALNLSVPSDKVSGADVTMHVDYYDGTGYVEAANAYDGTTEGAHSLAKSGTVSWTPPESYQEFPHVVANNAFPLYYYRIRWSNGGAAALGDVRIYHVTGIPAQAKIKKYEFAVNAFDSLLLCCETEGKKNALTYSNQGTAQVFNGQGSDEIEVGDDKKLTAAVPLYSQFGSVIYNIVLLYKANEMWAMVKNDAGFSRYMVDTAIGCIAPRTLQTIALPLETAVGLNRNLAIWRASSGIFVSDGRSPIPVHKDIDSFFDQNATTHVNLSMADREVGYVDRLRLEYHWLWASGSSDILDKEWVFDLKRWKWYEMDRGYGKRLQYIFDVTDTTGNVYSFGITETGYIERLDYGTTFDGNSIVSQVTTGDFTLMNDILEETTVYKAKLVMDKKATTTNNVTLTHYIDGNSTGVAYSLDPSNDSGTTRYFVARIDDPDSAEVPGVFHSVNLSMTTTNETVGFEPLHLALYYQDERQSMASKA